MSSTDASTRLLGYIPAPFQPLDPTVISASIPAIFIGRNRDGFWIARDAGGRNGGIFLFRGSAIAFARRLTQPLSCAIVLLSERSELDVENQGNPLVRYLGLLPYMAKSMFAALRRYGIDQPGRP